MTDREHEEHMRRLDEAFDRFDAAQAAQERRYRVNWWRAIAVMLAAFWLSVGMAVAAAFDVNLWAWACDVMGGR